MPKRFIRSFKYAQDGVKYALLSQRNMWIHSVMAFAVLTASVSLRISTAEWLVVIILISNVFAFELINTAMEEVVNMLKPEPHPLAALAKNASAAAVLMISGGAAIAGLVIFLPKVLNL
ncbi:MAG: diacylglycerol kinase family protein [Candidatus Margulisbacteria bacterium]|nr:diacylglycerol kinase family protein [Candidatus Margulisiibacteriota bacterium]MBU1616227.1 diacylglycerol kinase family protein [Candidatus Margulisiibacteriota bacterium]MBU1867509.1 diacylglycerol kinase family protein [Candidatus Margulisiibacteriota bacterium]